MKKTLLSVACIAALTVSCNTSPEKKIEKIFEKAPELTNVSSNVEKAKSLAPDTSFGSEGNNELVDYYTYLLVQEAGVKEEMIFTLDDVIDSAGTARNLVAEVKGKRKKNPTAILISAPVDDIPAAIAAINVLKMNKVAGTRLGSSVKLLLYQHYEDSLCGLQTFRKYANENANNFMFELDIRSTGGNSKTFSIAEPGPIYDKVMEIVPQYFTSYGNYNFIQGKYHDTEWPIKESLYKYTVDSADLTSDIAATASLLCIFN